MPALPKARVTLGYPWEPGKRDDLVMQCELRVPGKRYDTADGYSCGVHIYKKWMDEEGYAVGCGGSILHKGIETLDEAVTLAEETLVRELLARWAGARQEVQQWSDLLTTIGEDAGGC